MFHSLPNKPNPEYLKIYDLLRSPERENKELAIVLAQSQGFDLQPFWQALYDYYQVHSVFPFQQEGYLQALEKLIAAPPETYTDVWAKIPSALQREVLKVLLDDSISISKNLAAANAFLKLYPYCSQLKHLSISLCPLKAFPFVAAYTPQLEKLILQHTHIQQLDTKEFSQSKIRELRLTANPLLSHEDVWKTALQMPHLEVLNWAGGEYNFNHSNNILGIVYRQTNFHNNKPTFIPKSVANTYSTFIVLGGENKLSLPALQQKYQKENLVVTERLKPNQLLSNLPPLPNIQSVSLQDVGWNMNKYFAWAKQSKQLRSLSWTLNHAQKNETTLSVHTNINYLSITYSRQYSNSALWRNFIRYAALHFGDSIEYIHIKPNSVINALPNDLCRFTKLKKLEISGLSNLKHVPKDWSSFTQLEEINLSNTNLNWEKVLPLLSKLKKLKKLDLSNNKLTKLPIDFSNFKSLETLKLSRNQLTELPASFFNFAQLRHLWLNNNQLTKLSLISSIPTLEFLELSNNQFKTIPTSIAHFSSLTALHLNNNHLQELPEGIAALQQLMAINLSHNQFTTYPQVLNSLSYIQKLNLANNRINTLPHHLFQSSCLTHLHLSNNKIETLPSTVHLPLLRSLHLDNNPIKILPRGLDKSPYLSKLKLHHTALTSCQNIPLTSDIHLSLLQTPIQDWFALYRKQAPLEDAKIQWLKRRSFPRFNNQYLDIRGQKIKDWKPICQFIQQAGFRSVQLQSNDIHQLDEAFQYCQSIEELFLHKNPNLDWKQAINVLKHLSLRILRLDKKYKPHLEEMNLIFNHQVSIRFGR